MNLTQRKTDSIQRTTFDRLFLLFKFKGNNKLLRRIKKPYLFNLILIEF